MRKLLRRLTHTSGLAPKVERRKPRKLRLEALESRQLLDAGGMLQGYAFVDADADNFFDPDELPKVGQAIQLRSADGTALISTQLTNANGYYRFDNVLPGTYRLVEGALPLSLATSGATVNSNYYPASVLGDGISILVSVLDSKIGPWNVFIRNPSQKPTVALNSGTVDVVAGIGQTEYKLETGDQHRFFSFCLNPLELYTLDFSVPITDPLAPYYPVTTLSSPAGATFATSPAPNNNWERVTYLYTKYGTADLYPGGAATDPPVIAALNEAEALQLAIWELLYDASAPAGGYANWNTTGVFQYNGLGSLSEGTTVQPRVQQLLEESVGKSGVALYLDFQESQGGQSIIATCTFSFANRERPQEDTPKIDIEKTTNGPLNTNPTAPDYDNEDAVNGPGVPLLPAGTIVTWTYKVTNTGHTNFNFNEVVIVDDNGTPGHAADDLSTTNGQITFQSVLSGDADTVLEPGEMWLYTASGVVQNVGSGGGGGGGGGSGFGSGMVDPPGAGNVIETNLGIAGPGNWAVLALGGVLPANETKVSMTGPGTTTGNVGVANAGNLALSGSAGPSIDGDVYLGMGVSVAAPNLVTGTIFTNQDTTLDQAVIDAVNAAAFFNGLADTFTITGGKINSSMTITATTNLNVTHITDLDLNHEDLILVGTSTQEFVINVAGGFKISGDNSLADGSGKIILSGGLTPQNVVFNIVGTGSDVATSGGSSGNLPNVIISGILLAAQRKIAFAPGMVIGEIIAGGQSLSLVSGSQVEGLEGYHACYENKAVVTVTNVPGVTDSDLSHYCNPSGPVAALGDYVWSDLDSDGIQDANEQGVANVTVKLLNSSNVVLATTTTDANGKYLFSNLPPGDYKVLFVIPAGFDGLTTANVGANDAIDNDADQVTGRTGIITLVGGQTNLTVDAGLTPHKDLKITKQASASQVVPGAAVTYSYTVTSTAEMSNVSVVDDNGTPDYSGDDFSPGFVVGDSDNDNKLDPTETWTYSATKIAPQPVCDVINGVDVQVGTIITTILPNGNVKVVYDQGVTLNDNTYGANIVNWPVAHTLNSLLGSDKAQFVFKNGAGQVVMDFLLDYITATNTVPSGYKSLGVSGGDGSISIGSAGRIVSFDTSISRNFNSNGFGVTAGIAGNGFNLVNNSPMTVSSSSYDVVDAFFAQWEFRNIYEVVIDSAAFGPSGFGSVSVPSVHNSPPKLGANESTPEPCEAAVTNIAKATGTVSGVTQTASATATVQIKLPPPDANSVMADPMILSGKKVAFVLTNNSYYDLDIDAISVVWPSATNGKLAKIKLDGATLFDAGATGSSTTISLFKGSLAQRTIEAGESVTIEFEFANNVNLNQALYDFVIDFGGGVVVSL